MQDVESYFAEAPELPVEVPEPLAALPAPVAEGPSVLSPKTSKLTLREIFIQRKSGQCLLDDRFAGRS
jgi:hypothetical protein